MASVVVAGALANKAGSGGEAWVRLSWVLGLRRLGHDVAFLEQLPAAGWEQAAEARGYFAEVVARFGLEGRAALVRDDGAAADGLEPDAAAALVEAADLLVNISGHLRGPLASAARRSAYVDIDPGYTQIWHEAGLAPIAPHDVYFTIAENIGTAGCSLPTAGLRWLPTRQPVVLAEWPAAKLADRRFTTIATWRTPFGRLEHGGRTFGMKLDAFRALIDLPARVDAPFELALDIHPAETPDLERLAEHGWAVVDARAAVRSPDDLRAYVAGSGAEFSPAQGVYVDTASGWFSDRSARYLATGRPVLVHDTGIARTLPTGEGLLTFRCAADAAEGARRIVADHERHAAAARAVAEEHFDSDRVLHRFLECALA